MSDIEGLGEISEVPNFESAETTGTPSWQPSDPLPNESEPGLDEPCQHGMQRKYCPDCRR